MQVISSIETLAAGRLPRCSNTLNLARIPSNSEVHHQSLKELVFLLGRPNACERAGVARQVRVFAYLGARTQNPFTGRWLGRLRVEVVGLHEDRRGTSPGVDFATGVRWLPSSNRMTRDWSDQVCRSQLGHLHPLESAESLGPVSTVDGIELSGLRQSVPGSV